jgi:hypothetical protein
MMMVKSSKLLIITINNNPEAMKTMKIKPQILFKLLFCILCASRMNGSLFAQTPKTWEWVRYIGSRGWDITGGAVIDAKNNIYIAGNYPDTLKFKKKKYPALGQNDIFIAKYNDKGNLENVITAGGPHDDQVTCIALTANGDILIGGYATDTVTFEKLTINGKGKFLFIASLDVKGHFQWITQIKPFKQASLNFIGTSSDGSIYGNGLFTDSLYAGDKKVGSNGKRDVFIVKLKSTGEINKLTSFGGEGDDLMTAFSVSQNNELTYAGSYTKSFTLGNTLLPGEKNRRSINYLVQINDNLAPVWIKLFKGEEFCRISSLKATSDSSLYVGGSFNLSLNITDTLLQSNGLTDGFLIKLNHNGKLQWARTIGSVYHDYINHINTDCFGGVLITGSIGSPVTLDSLSIFPTSGGNTAYVAQFDKNGKAFWGDYISGAGQNFGETTLLDSKGNLYIYGSFTGKFEKDNTPITSYGEQDLFLARYYNCPGSKAEVIGNLEFCPGGGTQLKVKTGYLNVLWNDSISGRFLYINKSGPNWVSMYDKKGCLYSDTVQVTVSPLPKFFLGNDTLMLVSDSILLKAPTKYTNYRWQNRSYEPTYLVTAPNGKPGVQICFLTVTDSLNCSFSDTIKVTFMPLSDISVFDNIKLVAYPNPAIDNINWYIDVDKPYRFTMQITDENGKVLSQKTIGSYYPGEVITTNIRNLSQGSYYIRLVNSSGNVIKTHSFIKQ